MVKVRVLPTMRILLCASCCARVEADVLFRRGYDLAMKHVFNGKERDADEWRALLKEAHPGLKILRVQSQPGSILSLIEVEIEDRVRKIATKVHS